MAQNLLPNRIQDLTPTAHCIAEGLTTHGPWLGLTDISVTEFRLLLKSAEEAEITLRDAREAKELAAKRAALADRTLKNWLGKATLVIMLARGARGSASWAETGFADRRTAVPRQMANRIALAQTLVTFFARHPEFGVPFADVTAARGRSNYERLIQSNEMLQLITQEFASAKRQQVDAQRALRSAMRGVVAALSLRIAPCDERWTYFGLTATPRKAKRAVGPAKRRNVAGAPVPFVQPSASARNVAAA